MCLSRSGMSFMCAHSWAGLAVLEMRCIDLREAHCACICIPSVHVYIYMFLLLISILNLPPPQRTVHVHKSVHCDNIPVEHSLYNYSGSDQVYIVHRRDHLTR